MQLRSVGDSGLQVSRLGLGTLAWGHDVDYEDARKLVRMFVEAGGNLIDTAPAYGAGEAEHWLAKLMKTEITRDQVILATKAGFGLRDGKNVVDTSRTALLDDLRGSLKRLNTDHLDLWQIHAWGNAPLDETLAAVDYAVTTGMVRYAGICNFVGWQTAQAATWQRAFPGRAPITSAQVEYSLLARRAEVEIIPCVEAFNLGFFPWSPLGRGVLTGKYRTGIPRNSRAATEHFAWFIEPYLEQRSRSVVEAVNVAAEGLDMTCAQVALTWVRDAPTVTAPLIGPRTPAQLQELLDTEEMELPRQIVDALDDVTGGPNTLRQPIE